MSITENLKHIKNTLPAHVTLVAVSKTKPNEDIVEAYEAGQRIFGENKIQEMTDKYEALPKDIQWHMIGHVQRNKVKYMAPYVSLIHGVDSFRLLEEIDKQAKRNNRVISCLLQMFIAEEETKFGLDQTELMEILASEEFKALKNIKVVGLMGMATFTDNQLQVKKEFTQLSGIFAMCKKQFGSEDNLDLNIISMGMSNDYSLAIECGSTMVRIGSNIFGSRNY
ncbi:YggS family pyridoxal phosphate-dependent enzyme [Myroides marinus]|uniref:Pyridoxal phosphate homeostasis protein n=1 Tax=Myroides marinus TaxID=703342 RepID=A0A165RN64_9FLAO|nr:YggS family pyridoxal phosphate-dependent enzyme [Myroides marinus]KZE83817.1 alanine racemase [Myroides marinus]MDM1347253.1 YggS family pyridoxal phosphate-dependent enzyme [Myroides marinus]MDM1350277.1 YggS family pyridoxal phosphate-dependent enzyme [Myroides marinus]MDM1354082.1 YggS family pyridoxal phosphate-dependent enzyme [Myroides marinus]MDM1357484.1 YggS family pyridoxal phosphate-dependent enzyme [Myroides marinus]